MSSKLRRDNPLAIIALILLLSLAVGIKIPLWAASAEEERVAKIEGAKKEGNLVIYTNTSLSSLDPQIKRFTEKYPFIKIEYYRASAPRLMTRILAETRAGPPKFDVIATEGITGYLMMKKGLYAKYVSPESAAFPKEAKDPEGYWTSVYSNYKVIGYNTRMVSPRDVPKNWQDLLQAKWKGLLLMSSNDYEWFGNMLKIMGEEKGMAFMKKLSMQNPLIRAGHTLVSSLLATGEGFIVIASNADGLEELKVKRGAPVGWVGAEPVISRVHPIAVVRDAPHPNAARLYVDFILSKEGQEIVASTFQSPDRTDVKQPFDIKGVKLSYADLGLADQYEAITKKFDGIFTGQK